MINVYESKVGKLQAPFELKLGAEALLTYEYFNTFNSGALPGIFKNTIYLLDKLNHKKIKHNFYDFPYDVEKNDFCMNVLIAFSGSLDSVYQTLYLKDSGYTVTLFYLNYNTILGNKRLEEVEKIAEKLNLPLISCDLILTNDLFVGNSFSNLLLYSLMLDCCQANNIYYISSGDSLININNTNTFSNLKYVTETFFNELYMKFNFDFIPAHNVNKVQKLSKLIEMNLDQDFTDCVSVGKLTRINRNKLMTRLNISLPENNCGLCHKCLFYNLLRHYYFNEELPQNYLEYCWKHIITEKTYPLFNQDLSLATRINNLSRC